ncbi:MAG: hypothetical protein LLG00_12645 [Planctomycetaceae bacterium]|nr:hypothetical protein [Planctomycetaceae bacterium]
MDDQDTLDMTTLADGYGYDAETQAADWSDAEERTDELTDAEQEEQDQQIVDGLSSGRLVIASPEDQQRLVHNANARARIAASPYYTQEQKDAVRQQTLADDTRIRRAAAPIPPEHRAKALDLHKQRAIDQLPPDLQDKPWQFDPKTGMLQLPRGYKEEPPPDAQESPVTAPADDEEYMPTPTRNQAPSPESIPTIAREQYDQLPGGSWYVARGQENLGPQYKPIKVREHQQRRLKSVLSPELYEKYGKYYTIDHGGNPHFHKELWELEHPKPEKETPETRTERQHKERESAAAKKEKHAAERKRIDKLRELDFKEAYNGQQDKPAEERKSATQLWREAEVKFPYPEEETPDPFADPGQAAGTPDAASPSPQPAAKDDGGFDAKWKALKPGEMMVGPDGKTYRKKG